MVYNTNETRVKIEKIKEIVAQLKSKYANIKCEELKLAEYLKTLNEKKNKTKMTTEELESIGNSYFKLKGFKAALDYFQILSERVKTDATCKRTYIDTLEKIGEIYINLNQEEKAKEIFIEILTNPRDFFTLQEYIMINRKICIFLRKTFEFSEALNYYKSCYEFSREKVDSILQHLTETNYDSLNEDSEGVAFLRFFQEYYGVLMELHDFDGAFLLIEDVIKRMNLLSMDPTFEDSLKLYLFCFFHDFYKNSSAFTSEVSSYLSNIYNDIKQKFDENANRIVEDEDILVDRELTLYEKFLQGGQLFYFENIEKFQDPKVSPEDLLKKGMSPETDRLIQLKIEQLFYKGSYEKAIPLCLRKMEIIQKIYGNEDIRNADILKILALFNARMNEIQKRDELKEKSLKLIKEVYQSNVPRIEETLLGFAKCCQKFRAYSLASFYLDAS